jgi:AraC family transcriptional regulator
MTIKVSQLSPQLTHFQARQIEDHIHANLECELKHLDLSNLVELGRRQFFRKFANTFGTPPHKYVMDVRVERAKQLLSADQSLVEIAGSLGFASQAHFCGVFRKITGTSPGRFRLEHSLPPVLPAA